MCIHIWIIGKRAQRRRKRKKGNCFQGRKDKFLQKSWKKGCTVLPHQSIVFPTLVCIEKSFDLRYLSSPFLTFRAFSDNPSEKKKIEKRTTTGDTSFKSSTTRFFKNKNKNSARESRATLKIPPNKKRRRISNQNGG